MAGTLRQVNSQELQFIKKYVVAMQAPRKQMREGAPEQWDSCSHASTVIGSAINNHGNEDPATPSNTKSPCPAFLRAHSKKRTANAITMT